MCEKSLHHFDLGQQEPRGCRFIYGHPGDGEWHYCQRTIAQGGRAGDASHPPYCVRHTKVCVQAHVPYRLGGDKWAPDRDVIAAIPGRGDGPRLPVHIEMAHSHKGLSHD